MKFVPVIVTVAPVFADVGVNELIVGGGKYVKIDPLPVPFAVVTDTTPVAPVPTTALIEVPSNTVNEVAAVVPNFTAVAPVKFVPVMVIVSFVFPDVGLIDATVGGGKYVNVGPSAAPFAVVTDTKPVPPEPTTAVIDVALTTLNEVAATVPNFTAVAPVKLVPVKVTVLPVPAEVGLIDVIVGGGK